MEREASSDRSPCRPLHQRLHRRRLLYHQQHPQQPDRPAAATATAAVQQPVQLAVQLRGVHALPTPRGVHQREESSLFLERRPIRHAKQGGPCQTRLRL